MSVLDRRAKLAGALYLGIIVSSILSLILINSRLVVDGDPKATLDRIAADPTLFRVGLVYDALMFTGVVALSWALYTITRDVDRDRALLALVWRSAEGVLGAGTVVLGVLVALLATRRGDADLVDALLTTRDVGVDVAMVFMVAGSVIFCRLLLRAGYVPAWLGWLGIVGYAIIGIGVVVSLLWPDTKDTVMIAWAPGTVFEAGIGIYWIGKGIGEPGRVAVAG